MIEHKKTNHVLETRDRRGETWLIWRPANAGMYRKASLLAYHGRLHEAIESAEATRVSEFGDMHDVDFRCVTTSRTVTIFGDLGIEDRVAE